MIFYPELIILYFPHIAGVEEKIYGKKMLQKKSNICIGKTSLYKIGQVMDRVLDQSIICLPFFSLFIVLQHWDGNGMDPELPLDHFVEAWNFLNLSSKGLFGKTNLK